MRNNPRFLPSARSFSTAVNPARWSFNSFSQNVRREHCQIYELNSRAWSDSGGHSNPGGKQFWFFIRLPYVLTMKREWPSALDAIYSESAQLAFSSFYLFLFHLFSPGVFCATTVSSAIFTPCLQNLHSTSKYREIGLGISLSKSMVSVEETR